MLFRKVFLCSLIVYFVGIGGTQSVWAKETAVTKGKPDLIKEDIKRALDETTQLEFVDTPLADVIEYLKDLHKQKHPGFEIVLDTKTLSDLGIAADTPISKSLKGISLRSALRLLLRDLGLAYVIRNEVLLITSPEEACYAKVYDVADLVSPKEGEKGSVLDSLMGMIAKTCPISAPSGKAGWPSWIASLKSAEITAIVVYQPDVVQDDVADLLAQLRAARHSK